MAHATDLRTRARRRERAGNDERALDMYEIALRESRSGPDEGPDPVLCLRIADIHARRGEEADALRRYDEAFEQYARAGLLPNALSVAERILRLFPDRIPYHRRLAEIQLEMGHVARARESLLRYLEGARDLGDGEAAEAAIRELGRHFEDAEFTERAEALLEAAREAEPVAPVEPETEPAAPAASESSVSLEAAAAEDPGQSEESTLPASEAAAPSATAAPAEVEEGREAQDAEEEPAGEADASGPAAGASGEAESGGTEVSEEASGSEAGSGTGPSSSASSAPAVPPERAASGSPGEAGSGAPEDISHILEQLRETLPPSGSEAATGAGAPGSEPAGSVEVVEAGARGAGATPARDASATDAEADLTSEELGERAELRRGLDVLEEMLELAPDRLELWRRRIAYARRLRDPEEMREAFLGLGEGLVEESPRAARFLFERVLIQQPESSRAQSGLARLDAAEIEEKRSAGEAAGRGNHTRRVQSAEEQAARNELGERLWAEFEESVRQLPWLDGATQTFQAAGSEFLPPLEAFEMLGRYLLLRGKPADAARVLSLAAELEEYADEELVDVYFHLSTALRSLGRESQAEALLRRVAEVDPEFRDTWRLTTGEGEEDPGADGGV